MAQMIGNYEVLSELGRGGMGVVYKAFEPALNRSVALKMLNEGIAHQPGLVERFYREARAMATLSDPNVVQIYAVGEHMGQPYFVMEYIDGESLSARLKRERMSVKDARRLMAQAASGLAAAHERGLIHRDIKPGNLMLTQKGSVKVTDFGIALAEGSGERLTGTGGIVGTPGYLSPEACLGEPIDARTDIFALGVVFYEMLTGRLPFDDKSPYALMAAVVQAQIPDVTILNKDVDPNTLAILAKMLARRPNERFQTCSELEDALTAAPSTPPPMPPLTVNRSLPMPPPAAQPMYSPPPPYAPQGAIAAPANFAQQPSAPKSKSMLPWVLAGAVALGAGGFALLKPAPVPDPNPFVVPEPTPPVPVPDPPAPDPIPEPIPDPIPDPPAPVPDPTPEPEPIPAPPESQPADMDNDGIADAQDECPSERGVRAQQGCPPPPPKPVIAKWSGVAAPNLSLSELSQEDMGRAAQAALGAYTGKIDGGDFKVVLQAESNGLITGYNITKGNRRDVRGYVEAFKEDIDATGDTWRVYSVVLSEPGDNSSDGKFRLELKHTAKYIAGSGSWTSYSGESQGDISIKNYSTSKQ
jgi:eukaryotic-like serine/threonine-protein kinase